MIAKKSYDRNVLPKLDLVRAWSKAGLTNKEICHNIGISESTLLRYRENHPELDEAMSTGREEANYLVENALFQRAVGYSYDELTWERKKSAVTGKYSMVLTKRVRKQVIPDIAAAQYWLANRRSKKWKYRPEESNKNSKNDESIKTWLTAVKIPAEDIAYIFKENSGINTDE